MSPRATDKLARSQGPVVNMNIIVPYFINLPPLCDCRHVKKINAACQEMKTEE